MSEKMLLKNKFFWLQFVFLSVLIFGVVIVAKKSLSKYTRHGEEFLLTDLLGMQYEEVVYDKSYSDLNFVMTDSIYDASFIGGEILQQYPNPGSTIKPGRTIYLVVASMTPGKVKIPELRDISLRQALNVLKANGLRAGKIFYEPTFDKNAVQKVQINGEIISSGTYVMKGTVVDLVIGSGIGDNSTSIPFMYGMNPEKCRAIIMSHFLNVGEEHFQGNVPQNECVAVEITPEWHYDNIVPMGTIVDIKYKPKHDVDVDKLKFSMLFTPENRSAAEDYYDSNLQGLKFENIIFDNIDINGEKPVVDETVIIVEDDKSENDSTSVIIEEELEDDEEELF